MKINIDNFTYRGESEKRQLVISMNAQGSHLISNTSILMDIYNVSYFAERVPLVLTGLLILSAEVYAIDRSFDRKKESIDGWSREFEVIFKVPNAILFQTQSDNINSLLNFLTGDYWSCTFEEAPLIEWIHFEDNIAEYNDIAQVNLFSGGMDSLIGAIDYMEEHDVQHKLFLASHYDSKMGGPKIDQKKIVAEFRHQYQDRFIYLSPEGISPTVSEEKTCRSRSLMFLSIAIMIAAYKSHKVIVPENGPVSLNFPLSISRRAACSTRTTHPIFIQMVRDLLNAWQIPVTIDNLYEFKTKGEMVRECHNQSYLLSIVDKSNSCGKRNEHQFMYDNHFATHCGRCMPCMYRKAAMLGFNDLTTYGITMDTLFHKSQKVSNDFYAMLNYLKRTFTDNDIIKELVIMGMKKSDPHIQDYVSLVKRTREELKNLLRSEAPQEVLKYAGLL